MSEQLDWLLRDITALRARPGVEDVLVNAPSNVWTFEGGAYKRQDIVLDPFDIEDIAIVAAAQQRQNFDHEFPILSVDIPDSGRLQAILYPCVPKDKPCLVVRQPDGDAWPTLRGLAQRGLFKRATNDRRVRPDEEMLRTYYAGDYEEFFRLAVKRRKTIIACGETASGKTTLSKAMINEIPLDERLIVVEDAKELDRIPHPNSVAMFCKKDPTKGDVTALQLVEAALRMRIGRLFIQELRGGDTANAFLVALQTGHKGAITTVHAPNCEGVFDRVCFQVMESESGKGLDKDMVIQQLKALIDVIVHLQMHEDGSRYVTEVWFKDAYLDQG